MSLSENEEKLLMVVAEICYKSIPKIAMLLLASDAIPGLQEHFSNPENKRRFEEWQAKRQSHEQEKEIRQ